MDDQAGCLVLHTAPSLDDGKRTVQSAPRRNNATSVWDRFGPATPDACTQRARCRRATRNDLEHDHGLAAEAQPSEVAAALHDRPGPPPVHSLVSWAVRAKWTMVLLQAERSPPLWGRAAQEAQAGVSSVSSPRRDAPVVIGTVRSS
jgi:hypothetical protein